MGIHFQDCSDYELKSILAFCTKLKLKIIFQFPRMFCLEQPKDDPNPEVTMKLERYLGELNTCTQLADGNFVAGDHVTIADFAMCSAMNQLDLIDYDLTPYKNVVRWKQQMKELPFYEECHEEFEKFKMFTKTDEFRQRIQVYHKNKK